MPREVPRRAVAAGSLRLALILREIPRRALFAGFRLALILLLVTARAAAAQSVTLESRDAEVWRTEQTIRGDVAGSSESGTLSVGAQPYTFDVENGEFSVDVELAEGVNEIVACVQSVCSDTLRKTLAYELRPEVFAWATAEGRSVELHADVLESPNGSLASFSWEQDPSNPAPVVLSAADDSVAGFSLPDGAPLGEYYFDVIVLDEDGDEGRSRTFVTLDSTRLIPFDIWADHARWVDRAIVYEVTPYIIEGDGGWSDVTARLDEIAALGVNTLWIQPVFRTQDRGQGYDITDYFSVRPDLGTEQDLRILVETAKEEYGMKVLFDFVPNHTSIHHPYARDVMQYGTSSHYYDFYLTETDDAAYSQFYHTDRAPFIYYFWEDLVIVDWSHPEVYRWMMEAGRKWIEDYDIDGYRIDAVWGVNARTPEAMQRWRFDLKRLKPEIFLLGEDKATWPSSFDKRFDAAYDWYPEEAWVSHWTWQTRYSESESNTLFNTEPVHARSKRLRDALTNLGDGWHSDAKVFRFLQNNDTFPFVAHHGIERTRMAATLLFALPGIPMIYNGQEIGHDRHPYKTWQIFRPGQTIKSQDSYGLYEHYRDLTALRSAFPALHGDTFAELAVTPGTIQGHTFAFRRWWGDQHVLAVVNMAEDEIRARLELPTTEMGLSDSETYYLTDLFTGAYREISGPALRFPVLTVPGYSTVLFMLSDEVIQVPTDAVRPADELPGRVTLHQNYPNPFNPTTTIVYEIPSAEHVSVRVFDLLGREVAALVDDLVPAGQHAVTFDGGHLASGVYVYRIQAGDRAISKKMLFIE